jgi:hypothetical protein
MRLTALTAPRGCSRAEETPPTDGRRRLWILGVSLLGACALVLPVTPAGAASTQAIVGWGNTDVTGIQGVTASATPATVPSAAGASAAAVGGNRAFVLTPSGVLGVGDGDYGQLGLGAGAGVAQSPTSFTAIAGTAGATQVSASESAALVIVDGAVLAFGKNTFGDAGTSPGTIVGTPTAVPGLSGTFTQVASGQGSSYALRSDGTVWAWGEDSSDQLGSVSANTGTPQQVQGLPGPVKTIAAGYDHVLALLQDGTVWAWGDDSYGELGNGTEGGPIAAPVQAFAPPSGLGSSTYLYAFPYTGVAGTSGQEATEIPQPVGELSDVTWLASAGWTFGQIVGAETPVSWYASNTGGDARTTDASKFVTQTVGTLSFTHTLFFQSLGLTSTVTRVRITGTNARDFLLVGDEPEAEFPFTLAANGTALGVEVRFAPSDAGERSATLEVDADSGTVDVPLSGYGVALTGGPVGPTGVGVAGPAGPAGPAGAAVVGPPGPAGKNGVVTFAAKASKASVKPGHVASLSFTVGNRTTGVFPRTALLASAPKGLHVSGGKSAVVASLAAGKSRTVTLKLKVGAKTKRGSYRVKVSLKVNGETVTRTVQVQVR